jgi:DNA-binding transcriptional MocR family regulator
VTTSYQYPLGITMSLDQRLRSLDWAEKTESKIIEDDYDSEFRYCGHSISVLQGLDSGERVLYMGTYSKTMFPSILITYLIIPHKLVDSSQKCAQAKWSIKPIAVIGRDGRFYKRRRLCSSCATHERHYIYIASNFLGWLTII